MARVLLSVRCLPAARPVRVALQGESLLVATSEIAVLEAADRGDVLTIQLDGQDPDGSTWSVQVTGQVQYAAQTGPLASVEGPGIRVLALPLTVVHGDRAHWTRGA
jgi:hypothetical protein